VTTTVPAPLADAVRDESALRRFLFGLPGVDQVGLERRSAVLATRSIKKDAKLQAIDMAVSMIDLTTLEGSDTPGKVRSGAPLYGGVALEISPYDADVYVDGNYAGKVADFDGTVQPLTVIPGTHRIEVQAPGYAPLIFDVTVEGGQVVPYRGDLRPF